MALVFGGINIEIPAGQVPTGFTPGAVSQTADPAESTRSESIVTVKSVFENADPVVAFTALIADITSQIEAILTDDYDIAGLTTVDAYANLTLLVDDFKTNDSKYTTAVPSFTSSVTILVTTTA